MCAMRLSLDLWLRPTGDRSRERYRSRDRDLSTVLVDATCAMGALELQLEAAGDGFMHLVYGLNYGAFRGPATRTRRLGVGPASLHRVPGVRDAPHGPRDRGTTQEKTDTFAQHLAQRQYDRDCVHICLMCAQCRALGSRGRARTSGAETAHTPDRTERRGRAPGTSRGLATLRLSAVSQTIPPHASRCARGHPPTTGTARTDRSVPRRL